MKGKYGEPAVIVRHDEVDEILFADKRWVNVDGNDSDAVMRLHRMVQCFNRLDGLAPEKLAEFIEAAKAANERLRYRATLDGTREDLVWCDNFDRLYAALTQPTAPSKEE